MCLFGCFYVAACMAANKFLPFILSHCDDAGLFINPEIFPGHLDIAPV
jgi:hypothetical protein